MPSRYDTLGWYAEMDEDEIEGWRDAISAGAVCPICNDWGWIQVGIWDADHGTADYEDCPMCAPLRKAESLADEPAPF